MASTVQQCAGSAPRFLYRGPAIGMLGLIVPVLLGACQTAVPASSSTMIAYGVVKTPNAYYSFCSRSAEACSGTARRPEKVRLTPASFRDLTRVQRGVNRSVRYLSDRAQYDVEDYWTLPAGQGDCEDTALEKRRRLIALGYPRQALLLTVVRTGRGTGHLVLVVATDRGDFVLDNLNEPVLPWSALHYDWVAQQSRDRETEWVALQESGGADVADATTSDAVSRQERPATSPAPAPSFRSLPTETARPEPPPV